MIMDYEYFENDNAWFRKRAGTGLVCVDDVWTPYGWAPYTGDAQKPYFFGSRITEAEVPRFRKPAEKRKAVEPQLPEAALRTDDYSFAVGLARRLHDDETFAHVERVAARIKAKLSIGGPDPVFADRALIVAVLHDAVEDSPLSVDTVAALFSKGIAEAVDAISRRKKEGEAYEDYIDRARRNQIARIVKLADIEDHLEQAASLRPSLKPRYLEAREALKASREVSVRLLPDGRIEITSPEFPVQYVKPGGKSFGVTYDQFRAHGDGVMEVLKGGIINMTEQALKSGRGAAFLGFIPHRLEVPGRPELSAFPLNVLFVKSKIEKGVQISGSALYEPDLDTYRKDGDVSSMRYHNIYGTTSHLVIARDEENKTYHGEKFVNGKLVVSAEGGDDWQRFFTQLTMLGLTNGERCKFT